MSALKSLTLAIEVAERARDQAEQVWLQMRRARQHAQGQLDQLDSYAVETETRWATAAAATVSAELMLHHQHFLQRLRHAIDLQRGVVGDLDQQVETARQQRVQRELRLKALEQLRARKLTTRARQEARREQKQMDELATLQYMRSHAGMAGRSNGETR